MSPNLSSHNSVVLCAAAVKTIQNLKPRICLQTHPMDIVRRNRALFLGGIPFLVRVLDSRMIMVKLFFQVPYPFQTAAPFQDNFGETPLNHLPSPKAWPQAGPLLTPPSFKSLHSFLFLSTPFFLVVKIIVQATSLI